MTFTCVTCTHFYSHSFFLMQLGVEKAKPRLADGLWMETTISPCQTVRCKGEEILRHVCIAVSVLPVSACLCTTEEVQIPLNPTGCAGFQRAGKAIAACSQLSLAWWKWKVNWRNPVVYVIWIIIIFFFRKFGTGTKHTIKCSIEFYQVTLERFLFSLENNTGYCS